MTITIPCANPGGGEAGVCPPKIRKKGGREKEKGGKEKRKEKEKKTSGCPFLFCFYVSKFNIYVDIGPILYFLQACNPLRTELRRKNIRKQANRRRKKKMW